MGTHVEQLADRPYLGGYSLFGIDHLDATIKEVKREDVPDQNGKKSPCVVAYFQDGIKPMILNSTNRKKITQLLGSPDIDKWKGAKVRIITQKVKAFGAMHDALRIANELPSLPILDEKHPKFEQAKAALKAGSITLEQLKKNYDVRAKL
jgi:hypothetical protein